MALIEMTRLPAISRAEKREIPIFPADGGIKINSEVRRAERKKCYITHSEIHLTFARRKRTVSPRESFIIRGRVMSTANTDEAVIRYIFQRARSRAGFGGAEC